MIITEPSDFVAEVHDRMPVILARSSCERRPSKSHLPVRILHAQPTSAAYSLEPAATAEKAGIPMQL